MSKQDGGAVYISVSKDGWSGGFQLSVEDANGGFRLHGPKFNGSSVELVRHKLTARDCDELESYITKARKSFDAMLAARGDAK